MPIPAPRSFASCLQGAYTVSLTIREATGQSVRKESARSYVLQKSISMTISLQAMALWQRMPNLFRPLRRRGITFLGPHSQVHRLAGNKDSAKSIARGLSVSVTPGIDNISALTLLAKTASNKKNLDELAKKHGLEAHLPTETKNTKNEREALEEYAEALLQDSYRKNIPLISLEELQKEAQKQGSLFLKENPAYRLRLKYIGGGGGKGQRIVNKGEEIPDAVLEILSEAKTLGEADNKNFLMELNIENTRHNEIQLLGNGDWCISLGGRDCSIQMREQKQVELSITDELLAVEIERARKDLALWEKEEGPETKAEKEKVTRTLSSIVTTLEKDRKLLAEMERQAVRFAKATHLNSASTFECIVTEDSFFFMEMNTRYSGRASGE